jgi:AcrR family transcriptional regulator
MAPVRRDQIVRATIRCLARDGYAGLTMKRVAVEAGVSQGILHYYFRDKRAILAAAAERVTADLDRRVAAEARGARDARGRLRALVRTCLETAVRRRDFWTVFIEFWGEALHDRRLAAVNRRAYARARRLLGAGLARGIASGEFRPVEIDEAAVVVLALLDGVSLQLTFDRGLMSPVRAARLAEAALFRYLSAGGPT